MAKQVYEGLTGSTAEEYQRYFVPAIGAPVAQDLMGAAKLQSGERVLDVACGTGVVARLAAERVGSAGDGDVDAVSGTDGRADDLFRRCRIVEDQGSDDRPLCGDANRVVPCG